MRNQLAESTRGIGQRYRPVQNPHFQPVYLSGRWFCKSFRKGKKWYVWKNNFVTIRQTGTMTIWPKTKQGSRIDNF